MEEYDVIVTVEILRTVKAHDEYEAVEKVNDILDKDRTILMDNLGYEVNEAWKTQLEQFTQSSVSDLACLH